MDLPGKVFLFDQIHEIIWKKIRDGEIRPGQRLKDFELAATLGVSRTPVREAMHKMKQEGILIAHSSGGFEVRSASAKDLNELYRCRASLEGLAAEEAAERLDDNATKNMESLLERCERAITRNDFDKAFELNTEFHTTIINLANNVQLKTLLDSLWRLVVFYRAAVLNAAKAETRNQAKYRDSLVEKLENHREIFNALKAKDGAKASQLMQLHVRQTVVDHGAAEVNRPATVVKKRAENK